MGCHPTGKEVFVKMPDIHRPRPPQGFGPVQGGQSVESHRSRQAGAGPEREPLDGDRRHRWDSGRPLLRGGIFIQPMTSAHKLEASREGSQCRIYRT